MRRIAESFSWPFRARLTTWIWGCVMVLLLPVLFVPLLGYAIVATRSAELRPAAGPPAFRLSVSMLVYGALMSVVLVLTVVPFAFARSPMGSFLDDHFPWPYGEVISDFVLVLLWGVGALLFFPHMTASFAANPGYKELFGVASSLRGVRRDFATWNAVVAAIVTAWAIGLACAGLLCVGVVPGVFYAILVSAHATAALQHPKSSSPGPSTR